MLNEQFVLYILGGCYCVGVQVVLILMLKWQHRPAGAIFV